MKAATIGIALTAAGWTACAGTALAVDGPAEYDAIIAKHSAATGVPETLIRRVIVRESKYNPRAIHRGHYGMMQIKPATAKAMGYRGSAEGLFDADVNLTYGVRYLAGAYKVAGGNHDRAVRFYASGYYYDAKRKGMLAQIGMGRDGALSAPPAPPVAVAAAPAPSPVARVASFFTGAPQPAQQPAAMPQAAVPTPQARGPIPAQATVSAAMVASADPAVFVPVPQPRGPVAPTPAVQTAAAQPAAPLPPVRPVDPKVVAPAAPVLASATPAPSPRSRATDPVSTGSIAAVERPAVPMPPSRGTVAAQPAVASSAPKARVISPTAEPSLASAGPVVTSKPAGQQPLAFAPDAPKVAPIPLRR